MRLERLRAATVFLPRPCSRLFILLGYGRTVREGWNPSDGAPKSLHPAFAVLLAVTVNLLIFRNRDHRDLCTQNRHDLAVPLHH